jgi:hypothetical protein
MGLLISLFQKTAFNRQALRQGFGGAHLGAGRVLTGPADLQVKTPLHAAAGMHADAAFGQTGFMMAPGTGEHTTLTTHAPFRINDN